MLKKFRERAGLTAKEVAAAMGVSNSFYYSCEAGNHSLTLPRLQQFAQIVNVPIDEILGRTNAPSAEAGTRDNKAIAEMLIKKLQDSSLKNREKVRKLLKFLNQT